MPPVSVLIKPASGSCNLRCSYCFYTDEVSRRAAHGCGVMSDETMECLIRRIFESAETQVSIGFQGGEPLLAGLAYYERFTRLAAAYNRRGVPVQYSIQTNGLLLDEDWAAFFRRYDFLVGISVDGLRETHDANRVDPAGGGSYGQVAAAIDRLERRGVPFNILTVVNAQTAPRIREIYRDYMARGWVYQQYIPCLDPLGETPGGHPWSLTADAYGTFLCELFDLWYEDRRNGVFVYNRYFENLAALLLRYPTEACAAPSILPWRRTAACIPATSTRWMSCCWAISGRAVWRSSGMQRTPGALWRPRGGSTRHVWAARALPSAGAAAAAAGS